MVVVMNDGIGSEDDDMIMMVKMRDTKKYEDERTGGKGDVKAGMGKRRTYREGDNDDDDDRKGRAER